MNTKNLMDTDTKFFGTIIANRIQQYTKRIIYHSQVGFISEMQKRFIIGKSVTVIYHSKRMKDKNLVIIPTDAKKKKKSFNILPHLFMKNT